MKNILDIKTIEKDEIINCFLNYNKNKIKSLFIWTIDEYRQFASLYRCKKEEFSNSVCAFLNLWLAGLIDLEEWNNTYSGKEDECNSIYNHFFKDYLDRFNPDIRPNDITKLYIEKEIEDKVELIKRNRVKDPVDNRDYNEANLIFNGIYSDLKFIHENDFKIDIFFPKHSIKISEGDFYGEDFFIETEDEYILFME